ncbi:MAG: hypothetical protein MUP90_03550 [Gammaproteobacteria bacterium]|nr:hypothetical protein [Gammaproteobacteria bacterium]
MEKEILDPRAFKEVCRMNAAFLGLLYHCHGTPMASRLDGRSGLLELIVALTPLEAQILCTARAALFSLQLEKPQVIAQGVAEEALAPETGESHRLVREFGLVASGFAWHLSRTSPLAASLLLGWSRERAREFSALSLADVVRATLACSPSVQLRMCGHPRFWHDLIRSARHKDGRGWEVARTWSTQFINKGR